MGWHIIKQPDGKFALWSTIVDDFITLDATKEEITGYWLDDTKRDTAAYLERVFSELENGTGPNKSYDWEDCLDIRKEIHGDELPDWAKA